MSYAPRAFKVVMDGMVVQTSEVAHLVEIRSSSSLLRVISDGSQLAPHSKLPLFPKSVSD